MVGDTARSFFHTQHRYVRQDTKKETTNNKYSGKILDNNLSWESLVNQL